MWLKQKKTCGHGLYHLFMVELGLSLLFCQHYPPMSSNMPRKFWMGNASNSKVICQPRLMRVLSFGEDSKPRLMTEATQDQSRFRAKIKERVLLQIKALEAGWDQDFPDQFAIGQALLVALWWGMLWYITPRVFVGHLPWVVISDSPRNLQRPGLIAGRL